jgi:peptidoglycan/LPS O-acetylase OafA/YrhL
MKQRLIQIDILRCLAVVMVMSRHYSIILGIWNSAWIGVDLFFVLSGFLVSGLLFREYMQKGSVNAGLFFIRRGFKIYPAFWLMVLIYIAYDYYKYHALYYKKILAEIFFVQNFTPGIIGITWSLAVEEHFYIILILLTLYAIRTRQIDNGRTIVALCLSIAAICLAARTYIAYTAPFNAYTHFFPTYLRLDTLFAGVLVSWFYHFNTAVFNAFFVRYRLHLLILAIIGLQVPFFFKVTDPFLVSAGLTMLYMAFAIFLCLLLTSNFSWHLPVWKPLAFIGKCSYSIYLVHQLLGPAVANYCRKNLLPGAPDAVYGLIYLFSNLGVGILLSLYFEQFFLKIRDRSFVQPAGT